MANNRMYMKCEVCGEKVPFCIYFGSTYPHWKFGQKGGQEDLPLPEWQLNGFFDEHMHQERKWLKNRGPTHFELEFERP